MNNRYIFRGKGNPKYNDGEWYYGYLTYDGSDYQIVDSEYGSCKRTVIPETVGQCTGLEDKNGKLIFEGDVLKGFSYPFLSDREHNYYAVVIWFENSPAFGISTVKNPQSKVRGISDGNTDFIYDWDSNDWEVIGNKFDNPELLEVER